MDNKITSAIKDTVLNAALIITETDSRDIRFFEAFREKLDVAISDAISRNHPELEVTSIDYAGKVQWLPASKSKKYWVMSLGKATVNFSSKTDKEMVISCTIGTIEIYFSEGNRGYVCEGYNLLDKKEKKIKQVTNAAELGKALALSIFFVVKPQLTSLSKTAQSADSIYDIKDGIYPVIYGGIMGSIKNFQDRAPNEITGQGSGQCVILTQPDLTWIDPNENLKVKPMKTPYPTDKQFGFVIYLNAPATSIEEAFKYADKAIKKADTIMHSSGALAWYDGKSKTVRTKVGKIIATLH
ncbi:hypothetical protein [Ewingella americana]|uniref:Uncharacterized protein n=1 Tax=Ewingella americana TaxID=41202 RepID=A0A502GGY9_9GAMM|nr:hypothetical protein [Ewingella americana]TPG59993.1 hypothetical protein EAH77_15615 [Ewingella americana]